MKLKKIIFINSLSLFIPSPKSCRKMEIDMTPIPQNSAVQAGAASGAAQQNEEPSSPPPPPVLATIPMVGQINSSIPPPPPPQTTTDQVTSTSANVLSGVSYDELFGKPELWRLFKGKLTLMYRLCIDCQNKLFHARDKYQLVDGGVDIKIHLCTTCFKVNSLLTHLMSSPPRIKEEQKPQQQQ